MWRSGQHVKTITAGDDDDDWETDPDFVVSVTDCTTEATPLHGPLVTVLCLFVE